MPSSSRPLSHDPLWPRAGSWPAFDGTADAVETPIGLLPDKESLDLDGIEITDDALDQLFHVDRDSWLAECDLTEEYFAQFGDRVPAALNAELASLRYHLQH